ncbi:protein kinase domain-containing protein [Gordonia sp. (in: high G+C Gram-positive bacteria)]|uniref:protein kinase domain-containing protein n=1 Tax=Gordonia sp. (in: high G+C Gram-positive bacteria) TaxID=84139 RepID=UPI003C77E35B
MTSSDRVGSTLGRYRLVRLLGRGGMGDVYEAVDTDKDRTVALKLLPQALSDDADFRARFMRESRTVAKLNDPHIIPIHDFGELDGQLFLDMRIVRGRDLRSVIKDGPLEPARAVAIVEQVAGALDTAHATGLLHRDVKPENILLDSRDFAYLADFGLAQSAGQTRLTSTGLAIGSFAYMAPERFGTDTPPGPQSDVYALACVLYECLTGTQPFPSTSIEQIIAGHLSRPVPATGTAMDAVIATGMAKNPAARFPSAGALAVAAGDALNGRGALPPATANAVHGPTMVTPVQPPNPSQLAYPSLPSYPVQPQAKNGPKLWLIAAAVAAVALLAAGGVAWMAVGNNDDAGVPANAADHSTRTLSAAQQRPSQVPGTVTVTQQPPAAQTVPGQQSTDQPTTAQAPQRGSGDLGLSTPISTPPCDGSTATFVYNATTPGNYATEIASALAQYPGASYLRTDQSCSSLRQELNGNPIYAVYYLGSSASDTCAIKARVGGDAYARRLDNSTPVGVEIC